jgi:hypothetical protein
VTSPIRWSAEQLTADALLARNLFRRERLEEPLENWKRSFEEHVKEFRSLLEEHGLAALANFSAQKITEIFNARLEGALRYLAGPPISEDDLQVLVEAASPVNATLLSRNPEVANRVVEILIRTVDPKRFPWIAEHREPNESEKDAAILASAALLTAQKIATIRRNESKTAQERAVKDYLSHIGFKEMLRRHIRNMGDAPEIGEFCGESKVGTRKADIAVRIYDGRLMLIECKVSNSSLNSVKRINNDAAVKAVQWLREFGTENVIPVAVIRGVFNVANLLQAQSNGLALYWSHRLEDLGNFVTDATDKS